MSSFVSPGGAPKQVTPWLDGTLAIKTVPIIYRRETIDDDHGRRTDASPSLAARVTGQLDRRDRRRTHRPRRDTTVGSDLRSRQRARLNITSNFVHCKNTHTRLQLSGVVVNNTTPTVEELRPWHIATPTSARGKR